MKLTKIILLFAGLSVLLFSCKTENENLDFNNSTGELNSKRYCVYYMYPYLSRATCGAGSGVCFQGIERVGGDIVISDTREAHRIAEAYRSNYLGFQRIGDKMRIFFSKDIREESIIISNNVALEKKLAKSLGASKIVLQEGEYPLNFENFEFGEAIVPIEVVR